MPERAQGQDGFVTYGGLVGPELDASRWCPARLPLPGGGEHVPLDPNAEVVVGAGEVRVAIPRFSLSDDRFQSADSAKYLVFSTRKFTLPLDRAATFSVEMAVENSGGSPEDFRKAMAAFHVLDLDVSTRVFSVCGTSTRVLALHEQLAPDDVRGDPFFHMVESPYDDFADDFTQLRECEIRLDRTGAKATWRVDGHTIYEAHGTRIPERVSVGFGIWTMVPIRNGRSHSLEGQGLTVRWRGFRVPETI